MTAADASEKPVHFEAAAPSKPLEVFFAVVALVFTASYLFLSTRIPLRMEAPAGQIDARSWPILLGTIGVALSVVLLAIAVARPASSREDLERRRPGGILRIVLTCAITLVYVFLWSLASFVAFGYRFELFPIATALYLFVLMLVYGQRKWLGLIIYPIAVTALISVLFGMLLRIPL